MAKPGTDSKDGWPADAIERRSPSSLVPYAKNARAHPEAQIQLLINSFDEFGFVSPVLVDEAGVIIAGHGRHAAALRLGLHEIPVMVARGWSEAKKRRFRLLDNKVAENSTWDEDLLGLELGELRDDGVDLLNLGFENDDIERLLNLGLGEGEDAADDAADERTSKAGNLSARFGISPFSVLSARDGWWQDRKRAWLALGIQSELGRGAVADVAPEGAGLTWNSSHVTEPGLNHYRNKEKAGRKANAAAVAPMPLDGPKKRAKAAPVQSETA
jgi:hypothetical protein